MLHDCTYFRTLLSQNFIFPVLVLRWRQNDAVGLYREGLRGAEEVGHKVGAEVQLRKLEPRRTSS